MAVSHTNRLGGGCMSRTAAFLCFFSCIAFCTWGGAGMDFCWAMDPTVCKPSQHKEVVRVFGRLSHLHCLLSWRSCECEMFSATECFICVCWACLFVKQAMFGDHCAAKQCLKNRLDEQMTFQLHSAPLLVQLAVESHLSLRWLPLPVSRISGTERGLH